MIYIAERLALIHGDATKAALIESAHSQWGRQPQFQWVGWDDMISNNLGANRLRSGASNMLELRPVIGPVKANIGHYEQTSVGPLSRLLNLHSDCNSALETHRPYQEYSMGPFDISSKEDYYDGATEMLAVMETTSTKVITPGLGHQNIFSLDEESTALQFKMANKHDVDLHGPAMKDIMSGGETLYRTDSQKLGTGAPQGSAVDQANEPVQGMSRMHPNPAHSRNSASTPWVSDNWPSQGGMTSDIPPTSRGQRVMKKFSGRNLLSIWSSLHSCAPLTDIKKPFEHTSAIFPLYSTLDLSTDDMLASEMLSDQSLETGTTAICRRVSGISSTVDGTVKTSNVLSLHGGGEIARLDDFDYDRHRPSTLSYSSHSIVRSDSPLDDSNRHKLLV